MSARREQLAHFRDNSANFDVKIGCAKCGIGKSDRNGLVDELFGKEVCDIH